MRSGPLIGMRFTATAALFCSFLAAAPASAQNYPSKPVRLVMPAAAGGGGDVLTRIIGEALSRSMGQPMLVDNRPGGTSTIGTAVVAKAPPDGYTLLLTSSSLAVSASLFGSELPYDTLKDLAPIGMISVLPLVVVVNPGVPANNMKELIAVAKAKPGALNYASLGTGSPAHLAAVQLESQAGIKLTHVPYKGNAQGNNDTVSGQVQLAFPGVTTVLPLVKQGKLRALGIASLKRTPLAPDIPTVAETLPGYQAGFWQGLLAPAGTPRPIITRLNAELIKALNTPEVVAKLTGLGQDIETSTPEEFATFLQAEIVKWGRLIKEHNIKVDMER